MAGQSNRKVVKYRRKPKAAGLIFAIVIIYIVCFIVMYLSKSKVQTYEVEAGSLTTNSSYTGIAVRSEAVYRSEYSGNINYYQRENTRLKEMTQSILSMKPGAYRYPCTVYECRRKFSFKGKPCQY